jgi:hypothetical protein
VLLDKPQVHETEAEGASDQSSGCIEGDLLLCGGRPDLTSAVEWLRKHGAATDSEIVSALKEERSESSVTAELIKARKAGVILSDACIREKSGYVALNYVDDSQLYNRESVFLPLLKIDELIESEVEKALITIEGSGEYASDSDNYLTLEKMAFEVGRPTRQIEGGFYHRLKARGWVSGPNGFKKPGVGWGVVYS